MTIQFASDLHIEFPQNKAYIKAHPLIPNGEILILSGDIVPFSVMNKHKDFFSYVANNFEQTYWLPGNHEYYSFDITKKSGILNERIKANVHLVNNITLNANDISIIFSTLWTNINPENFWQIERSMSDFQQIRYNGYRFSVPPYNKLHEECLAFLKQELLNVEGKSIVVTHHVPTFKNYPQAYKGGILDEAFAVELFDIIETNGPSYWIYGHHHSNIPAFEIGKTILLTNQLGYLYAGEQSGFDNAKTINL